MLFSSVEETTPVNTGRSKRKESSLGLLDDKMMILLFVYFTCMYVVFLLFFIEVSYSLTCDYSGTVDRNHPQFRPCERPMVYTCHQ